MRAKAGDRGAIQRTPAPKLRSKNQAHPHLNQWLRVLMATFLICVSLALGSIVGVLAQTFAPTEKWVKVPITDPATGEVKRDPSTGEIQYTQVKSEESGQLLNPLDVINIWNNLDRKVNILLLGSDYNYVRGKRVNDKEAGTRSRTDTIMLASLDPSSHRVNILSIPRDTHVLIPGYHYDKVNAAMTYGGVDLVKKTVSELTGVPIDYYMALKVDGLVNTVDILGGIRMYVEKDMHYQDDTAHLGINIHKGWKDHMNGQQAHGYIRFRHDELGDIGRVQRQQKFIHAVLEKLLEPNSWLKFPALMDHLSENIETDLPQEVVGQIIRFGTSLKKDDLHMVMLPGSFYNPGGVSYWQMDAYLARTVIPELFPESSLAASPEPNTPTPTPSGSPANPYARYRVAVWNATTDYQVGREVVRRLREAGWNVSAVYKAPSGAPKTRFIAQTGKSELLQDLVAAVGFTGGESMTASVGDIASDFTVLIEEDLAAYLHKTMSTQDWNRPQTAPLPGTSGYRRSTPALPPVIPQRKTQMGAPLQPVQRQAQPASTPSQSTQQSALPIPQATPLAQAVPPSATQNIPPSPATVPASTQPRLRGNPPPQAPATPSGDARPHDPLYD